MYKQLWETKRGKFGRSNLSRIPVFPRCLWPSKLRHLCQLQPRMKFACPDSSSSSFLSYCPSPWIPASSREDQRPNTSNEKQAGCRHASPSTSTVTASTFQELIYIPARKKTRGGEKSFGWDNKASILSFLDS